MFNQNEVAIVTSCVQRLPLFEETMRRFYQYGYTNIWVQDTGMNNLGQYQGPSARFLQPGFVTSCDYGLVMFQQALRSSNIKHVLHMHCDCFVQNPVTLDKYLESFIAGDYDYASYILDKLELLEGTDFSKTYLTPILKQEILGTDPAGYPIPSPNWENALMLFKKDLWDSIPENKINYNRLLVQWIYDNHASMASMNVRFHQRPAMQTGDGWIHVGGMASDCSALQSGNLEYFQRNGEFGLARLGFFLWQEEQLKGKGYTSAIVDMLYFLCKSFPNGVIRAKEAWAQCIKGTCLEFW